MIKVRILDRCEFCDGEAYDWFTEGFSTLDLREAKALLQELDR